MQDLVDNQDQAPTDGQNECRTIYLCWSQL